MILVTARRDREHGVTLAERAPQRALSALQAPVIDRPAPGALLSAEQVATRLGVERSWVYDHAEELVSCASARGRARGCGRPGGDRRADGHTALAGGRERPR